MSENQSKGVSEKSPFAGCAIFIVALLVIVFLIGFSVSVLFRQFNAISKFTGEKPAVIEVVPIEGREAELNRLAEKIEAFRQSCSDDETASLEMNSAEINLAIAAYEDFKDLRGSLTVEEITPQAIRLGISFRLNGKPRLAKNGEGGLVTSDSRYLNGTMVAVPGLLQREVVLAVKDIEVSDKKVAPEFIAQMSPYRIAERYVGDGGIGSTMAKLTTVSLGDGVVRFKKTKGVVPKDTLTNQQVDAASKRHFTFLGIAACVFLLFVAIVIFLGLRLKKRNEKAVSGL